MNSKEVEKRSTSKKTEEGSKESTPKKQRSISTDQNNEFSNHFELLNKTKLRAPRHIFIIIAFLCFVVGPTALSGWYLYTKASDQYASRVGFVVRQADASPVPSLELLGSSLGGVSSTESDMLVKFIESAEMVALLDKTLNVKSLYSKPVNDPIFAFDPSGSAEDLLRYWRRMVKLIYEPGSGLMELRVLAFNRIDAQSIATEIQRKSGDMINELSTIARNDSIRYAQEDLQNAQESLKQARNAITFFRNVNQIVDPSVDIKGQMGLLNTLQAELAQTLIEADLLAQQGVTIADPRFVRTQRKVKVISKRIEAERSKIGISGGNTEAYSNLVGEYESLVVDRQFSETAYIAAREIFEKARSDANRQTRYLATYIKPTLADESEYPKRNFLILLVGLFSFLLWAIASLIFYSVRDRR